MNYIKRIQGILKFYRPLSYYILVALLLLPFYTTIKGYLLNVNSGILNYYAYLLKYFAQAITTIFLHPNLVDQAVSLGTFKINTQLMAIWQSVVFCVAIIVLPFSTIKKLMIILSGLFSLTIFNVVRIVLLSYNALVWSAFSSNVLNNFSVLLLNATFIYGLNIWFSKNYALRKLLLERIKIPSAKLRSTVKKIIWALAFLILISFFTNTQLVPFIYYMVFGILKSSVFLLNKLDYSADMVGERLIQGPHAGIYFADACLGLELMVTFALFIAILGGKLVYKIWFISLGILIIYGLNIARITLIFIHLVKNQGHYRFPINYHDVYSYSVYMIVFVLWVIWINKFSKTTGVNQ